MKKEDLTGKIYGNLTVLRQGKTIKDETVKEFAEKLLS